jgi:Cof subfamily protein (haloacid dehalogenase superfamily)
LAAGHGNFTCSANSFFAILMKIRLLAIDLDGTLLTRDKRILASSLEAIREAQAAGVTVVLASGRIRPSMRPFAQKLGLLDGPIICGNGTHVAVSPLEDLYHLAIQPKAVEAIAKYAWDGGYHLNLYTHDRLFFLRDTPWGDLYRSRVETVVPETLNGNLANLDCLKVLLVDDPANISNHSKTILELLGETAVRATESEPEYLEFMDPRGTKGYALASLAKELGIEKEEVAAIGDYLNDLEMIQFATLSAAVSNAHPVLKDTAKVVVSSNEDGGVSEFIRLYVLKHQY